MLCVSAANAVMRCLCVYVCLSLCVYVCLSRSCIVSKRIKISWFFSPSGSHTILVFPHQTQQWQYSDPPPPNGGVECRRARLKSWNQWLSGLAVNNCCTVCISHCAAGFLFTAGIRRPSAIDALCTVRYRPSAVSRYTQSRWTWIVRIYDSNAGRYAEDNRTESNNVRSW